MASHKRAVLIVGCGDDARTVRAERRAVHRTGIPREGYLKKAIMRGAKKRKVVLQLSRTIRYRRGALLRREARHRHPQRTIAYACLVECDLRCAREHCGLAPRSLIRLPERSGERRHHDDENGRQCPGGSLLQFSRPRDLRLLARERRLLFLALGRLARLAGGEISACRADFACPIRAARGERLCVGQSRAAMS